MGISEVIMYQGPGEPGRSVEEHLARELALYHSLEAGAGGEHFSLWEATRPVVVVGRSTPIAEDVDLHACRADGVAVVRRSSGGGAVVLAPGCLNYAVALSVVSRPCLIDVAGSFALILDAIAASLDLAGLSVAGRADLAFEGRKVSGNAQRRGRRALLHHGTLLYDFDARLAVRYLKEPVRRPAYRAGRSHTEFLGNVPLPAETIHARLRAALASVRKAGLPDGAANPPPTAMASE
jgi:lipoate-protein ligase A